MSTRAASDLERSELLRLLRDMGRWAQAKRRGGRGRTAAALSPPPAPSLFVDDVDIIIEPTGADDFGGAFRLETSATGSEPWSEHETLAWDPHVSPGTVAEFAGLHLRVIEVGNGVAYNGESPPSAILHL